MTFNPITTAITDLFDWLTHSQGIVDYLLQEVPSLKPEYETVHQLREAFKERNFIEF